MPQEPEDDFDRIIRETREAAAAAKAKAKVQPSSALLPGDNPSIPEGPWKGILEAQRAGTGLSGKQALGVGAAGLSAALSGFRIGRAPGAVLGGTIGLAGGLASPETALQQAASNTAQAVLPPGTGIMLKALASGGGAGLEAYREKPQNPMAAINTGVRAAGMDLVSGLIGMAKPGALRQGMGMQMGKLREWTTDKFGALLPVLSRGQPESIEGIFSTALQKGNMPKGAKAYLSSFFQKGTPKNVDPALETIFKSDKLAQGLFVGNTFTHEQQRRLLGTWLQRKFFSRPFTQTLRPGILGTGKDVEYMDTHQVWEFLRDFKAGAGKPGSAYQSYASLSKPMKDTVNTMEDVFRFLDPSEAVAKTSQLGAGLAKVGIFSGMRLAARQTGAAQGFAAGVGANLILRLTDPNVQKLIKMAAKGEIEAARQIGRTLGIASPELLNKAFTTPLGQDGYQGL